MLETKGRFYFFLFLVDRNRESWVAFCSRLWSCYAPLRHWVSVGSLLIVWGLEIICVLSGHCFCVYVVSVYPLVFCEGLYDSHCKTPARSRLHPRLRLPLCCKCKHNQKHTHTPTAASTSGIIACHCFAYIMQAIVSVKMHKAGYLTLSTHKSVAAVSGVKMRQMV